MAMKHLVDSELISLYREGDEKAFEVLLMRHKDKIYRFIYLKIKDSALASDLFQETFIKIINTIKLGNYNEEGKFLPWAMRIAHNMVIDYFRKANKVKFISESSSDKDNFNIFHTLSLKDNNIQDNLMLDELKGQMVQLLDYLPEDQREMVKMRIFQDLSFKDIAEMEDISINTALGRMRYALMNMRKLIDKHQLTIDI
jgi:RNA polymerase sigma-70 factor (ECF subfamily)